VKLYKIKVWKDLDTHPYFTIHFVSSLGEIKPHTTKQKKYQVWEATIKDRITKQDLIDLLEGDSPGRQTQKMTPVDLITELVLIKEKG